MKKLSVLISGGGTGGHIFPALAIGKGLQAKYPDALIEYVGAKDKMEMQKVPEAGFKIYGLWISGIDRKLSLRNFAFPFKLISSILKSYVIIKRNKPDIVIGVGGFASGPLLFVANKLGIPTLIQEQNGYPGITNKLLAKQANKICVAFNNMERFFPKNKIVLTGNPIRRELFDMSLSKEEAKRHFGLQDAPTILIIGGSLGARTINLAIEQGLQKFKDKGIQLFWQTGKFYTKENNVYGVQTQFIREMGPAYRAADIVISRAGASSLSEISALGKASILVPSPNVTEDHQTKNAQSLVEINGAIMVKDSDAMDVLVDQAIALLQDESQISELEKNVQEMARPHATDAIVGEIEKLINLES